MSRPVAVGATAAILLAILSAAPARADVGFADLSVTDTGPAGPALADDNLTYALTVSNGGLLQAADATLSDELPPDAIFVLASDGGTYDPFTQTVTWQFGSIDAGSSEAVTVVYQPVEPGSPSNSAHVTSSTSDSDLSNNDASADIEVDAEPNTYYVSLTDNGFSPAILRTPPPPVTIQWNVFGPNPNGVHESYGLGLFDSGTISPIASCPAGPTATCGYYRSRPTGQATDGFTFSAEITSKDLSGDVFKLAIPVDPEPRTGTISTRFTITYASGPLPPNYVEDLQIRVPGGNFVRWKYGLSGTSTTFDSSDSKWKGPGIYAFRDRLRNKAKPPPAHSKQGPAVPITVTAS